MQLLCGQDPVAIKILDEGIVDMKAFKKHVASCEICRCGLGKIISGMIEQLEQSKNEKP